ncbi:MAG: hypothetical protein NTY93_00400 [Candidatus Kaiserbacteria bacterium]|nr:hypothetical protein [Candidatus Kaiserbacteria bacterium]
MIRGLLVFFVFISIVFLPWPFAVALTLISSFFIPLLPLAAGLFADTLYYTPHAGLLPFFTLYGVIATIIIFFVRSRLKTSTIGR